MMIQLTRHPIINHDLTSQLFFRNMSAGDVASPTQVDPATFGDVQVGYGEWYKDGNYFRGDSILGDYAGFEFQESFGELRVVTKAKYNTGWLTVWEYRNNVWVQVAELTSNYNLVSAIALVEDCHVSWTLPTPLTAHDAGANADKLAEPGADDFLNIEFYISFGDGTDANRRIRILNQGGAELPLSGCHYIGNVPILSTDLITGVAGDVERRPYHHAFSISSEMYDNTVPSMQAAVKDRWWNIGESTGTYVHESGHENMSVAQHGGIMQRANGNLVLLCYPHVGGNNAESIDGNSVVPTYLREYTADGIFVRSVNLTDLILNNVPAITVAAYATYNRIGGIAMDPAGAVYVTILGIGNRLETDDYLIKVAADFTYERHVTLPTSVPTEGDTFRWDACFTNPTTNRVFVARTDGLIRRFTTTLAVEADLQYDLSLSNVNGISPVSHEFLWSAATSTWLNISPTWRRIFVTSPTFQYLRHFGDSGANTVGGIMGSGGICIDANNRVYNGDQYTAQCWKADGALSQGQQATSDQVAFVVGNENGTSNLFLSAQGPDIFVDADNRFLGSSMTTPEVKVCKDAKSVRDVTFASAIKQNVTKLSTIYGKAPFSVGGKPHFSTIPSHSTLAHPLALKVVGNTLYVLESRRRVLAFNVADVTAPYAVGRVSQTVTASAGSTITLNSIPRPETIHLKVNGIVKTLRKAANQDAGSYDFTTNPENFFHKASAGNDASGEQAITTTLNFATPFTGGETVEVSYVPVADTTGEWIIPDGTYAASELLRCMPSRMDAISGKMAVLMPLYNSLTDVASARFSSRYPYSRTASHKGKVVLINPADWSGLTAWTVAESGWKSDIKLITRSATTYVWLLDFENARIREYSLAGALTNTYNLSVTKPTRFSKGLDPSGNILVAGSGKIVAVNVSGVEQYSVTEATLLQDVKGLDVAASGNIYVASWNAVHIFTGSPKAYTYLVDPFNTIDYEYGRQNDIALIGTDIVRSLKTNYFNGGYPYWDSLKWFGSVELIRAA